MADWELEVFMPYGRRAASARVRVSAWLERIAMDAHIHDFAGTANNRPPAMLRALPRVISGEVEARRAARRTMRRALIHREVTPFSNGAIEQRIARSSRHCVYDFDDALYASGRSGLHRFWSSAESCKAATASADVVLAGSETLAEWASARNPDVRLIPTCVEHTDYAVKVDYEIAEEIEIVWLGSPSNENYISLLSDALKALSAVSPVRLTVISSGSAYLGAVEQFVRRVPWYPGVERTLAGYDIGVAPLFDGPAERGKCAYKVLQYAASGLPVVASPVGANAKVIDQFGYLRASKKANWAESLVDLSTTTTHERRKMGVRARETVARLYDYEVWEGAWLEALCLDAKPGRSGTVR